MIGSTDESQATLNVYSLMLLRYHRLYTWCCSNRSSCGDRLGAVEMEVKTNSTVDLRYGIKQDFTDETYKGETYCSQSSEFDDKLGAQLLLPPHHDALRLGASESFHLITLALCTFWYF